MKHLEEYRDRTLVLSTLAELGKVATHPWTIMEICGGQTHSLVKNGILNMLPKGIQMVHGPGCPVCVTSQGLIDQAIHLAEEKAVILCSFGDMLRVPGKDKSLLESKAGGADIRIFYSPLEAVALAQKHPDREVVFFAVGFETTAPANALSVLQARQLGLKNYSILTSHVLVPPAMEAILCDPDHSIDAFLAAGHVCTIMGLDEYYPIAKKYKIPIVVTGFEPVDLVQGIYMAVMQLEAGIHEVENQYARVVRPDGNPKSRHVIESVFATTDREWRGIGEIPGSGYELHASFADFDAKKKFNLSEPSVEEDGECIAGSILKGKKKPFDCPNFGTACTPENPLGAPMVSSEGACAAYYHYARYQQSESV